MRSDRKAGCLASGGGGAGASSTRADAPPPSVCAGLAAAGRRHGRGRRGVGREAWPLAHLARSGGRTGGMVGCLCVRRETRPAFAFFCCLCARREQAALATSASTKRREKTHGGRAPPFCASRRFSTHTHPQRHTDPPCTRANKRDMRACVCRLSPIAAAAAARRVARPRCVVFVFLSAGSRVLRAAATLARSAGELEACASCEWRPMRAWARACAASFRDTRNCETAAAARPPLSAHPPSTRTSLSPTHPTDPAARPSCRRPPARPPPCWAGSAFIAAVSGVRRPRRRRTVALPGRTSPQRPLPAPRRPRRLRRPPPPLLHPLLGPSPPPTAVSWPTRAPCPSRKSSPACKPTGPPSAAPCGSRTTPRWGPGP